MGASTSTFARKSVKSTRASRYKDIPGYWSGKRKPESSYKAGQTLAIAGLVQSRVEAGNGGLPWISEVPYLGTLFRNVNEKSTNWNCSSWSRRN